jgi:hypothetical protein
MIGMRRLDNIEMLVTDLLATGTPGDLLEAGVMITWLVAQRSTASTPRTHAEPIR